MKNLLSIILTYFLAIFRIEKLQPNPTLNPQDGADTVPEEVDIYPTPNPEIIEEEVTSRFHWIFDPGHGPKTRGKQSPPLPEDGYIFKEYEYNHDIVRRVRIILEGMKISNSQTVHLHPELGNALQTRTDNANSFPTNKPKRTISIHANAVREIDNKVRWRTDVEGTETFIHPNASPASREMANCINDRIAKVQGAYNRGIKTANFHMLRETNHPACLCEINFFVNPDWVRVSRTEEHRNDIANAFVSCILELENFSSLPEQA